MKKNCACIAALIACSLQAIGCGADGEDPEGEAALALGSAGDDGSGFIDIEDGSQVELIPGAQGGFHVWVSLEVYGAAGDLRLERDARRTDDGTLVLRALPHAVEVPEQAMNDWWRKPLAVPSFMCPSPIGVKVQGESIDFRVELQDADGLPLAESELSLTPQCPDGEHYDFCIEICSG